jgi:hypothetical protein
MNRHALVALVLALVALFGCAKSEAPPLPGDSVGPDGAVRLTPGDVPLARTPSTLPVPIASEADAGARASPEALGAIEARVFPPELVMEHQLAIALAPEQLLAIQKEVEKGQKDMLRLQWELAREKEKLAALLDGPKVDERKVAEGATELMKRENAIKAAHLGMLVRVKNLLTSEQQTKLRALRGR